MRVDALDEADARGLLRIDDLAGQDHLHRAPDADEFRQVARAARFRNEAGGHGDLAEPRAVRGVAHVAGGREFEPDADRRPVDRRDGDRFEFLELADGALDDDVAQVVEEVVREQAIGSEIAEVVACVERAERTGLGAQIAAGGKAAPFAGDDDDADAAVAADLVEQDVELDPHLHVDGIERLRPPERDQPDRGLVGLLLIGVYRAAQRLIVEHDGVSSGLRMAFDIRSDARPI